MLDFSSKEICTPNTDGYIKDARMQCNYMHADISKVKVYPLEEHIIR